MSTPSGAVLSGPAPIAAVPAAVQPATIPVAAAATTAVPQGYSFIFSQLVKNDNDFIGIVAYTVYKRQKIEWITKFTNDNKRAPDENEVLNGFGVVSTLPSQLTQYKDQALQIIDDFLEEVLTAKLVEEKQRIRDEAIIKTINKSFWRGVGENVVAGVVASLMALGAAGLFWVSAEGPEKLFLQAIDKMRAGQNQIPAPEALPAANKEKK